MNIRGTIIMLLESSKSKFQHLQDSSEVVEGMRFKDIAIQELARTTRTPPVSSLAPERYQRR